MAEEKDPASGTPDIATIVKDAVKDAIAAVRKDVIDPLKSEIQKLTGKQADLEKNQEIIANTLKDAPPAKKDDPAQPAALTPEAINKQIADGVANALKARDDAARATADQDTAKKALREKVIKEKLGGDADLGAVLPDTGDEAALTAAAEALAGKIKTFKPDFGGASANGGTSPTETPAKPLNPNLSEGTAKLAAGLKFDSSAAAAPAK